MSVKFKTVWLLFISACLIIVISANENGPLAFNSLLYVTGAPGDQGTCANCHTSVPNNQQSSINIDFNNGLLAYQPGQTYNVSVTVTGSTINKYGFQMTSLKNSTNTKSGKFIPSLGTDTFYIQLAGSPGVFRRYIEQNTAGTGAWNIQWTAPTSNVGPITFYAAGNAAQFPTGATGDKPCTGSLIIHPAMPPTAAFTVSDTVICQGDSVIFTNQSLLLDSTFWRFSGGTPSISTGENPVVYYNNPGVFDVRLLVFNPFGSDTIFKSQLITVVPSPTVNCTVTDVTCNGANNGSIVLTVLNGTPPYTYSWSNGSTTMNQNLLQPGVYCVTVLDVNGCTAFACDTVFEPDPLMMTVASKNVSCYSAMDGWIKLDISGGTRPYNIQWKDQIGDTLKQNLGGGNYHVTITDGNNCEIIDSVRINEPDSFKVSTVVTPETITGNDGNIFLNVSGATPPYTYQWSNGPMSRDNTNIPGGQYSVVITDDSSCTKTVTEWVPFPVGINNYNQHLDIKIYPNPSNQGFYINLGQSIKGPFNFSIYNRSGMIIEQGEFENREIFIGASVWPSGIYLIEIRTKDGIYRSNLNVLIGK